MRAVTTIRSGLATLVGLALLLTSSAALAGPFIGIDYGPFHEAGQHPSVPVPDSQFLADLTLISQKFTYIKTYGDDADSRLDQVVPLASTNFPRLKFYQGIFENSDHNSSANT